ncbi:MAG: FliA/WhiG family RNA polymerase sigma factor [Firmicutes bacterium]|nr:FliA/WhiG family RNA polymerase sigma factor [Bacillota bacterium]
MNGHDIWQEYIKTREPALKERLVLEHLGLVKYLAGRLAVNAPPAITQDDLEGYGVIGLLDAIDKFDPEMGTEFKNYAYTRVRGSMLDEIRKQNWVPRSKWQKFHEMNAIKEHMLQNGKNADENMLALKMGVNRSRVRQLAAEYSTAFPVSLDDSANNESEGALAEMINDPRSPDPLDLVTKKNEKESLEIAVGELPERDRLILALYYQEELTLKEIGSILEVTESRVCQLHTKVLQKLREKLLERKAPVARRKGASI